MTHEKEKPEHVRAMLAHHGVVREQVKDIPLSEADRLNKSERDGVAHIS